MTTEQQQAQADYDHGIKLQEQFAAALDKLVGDYAERGLGPRNVWTELTNCAASIEGDD